MQSIANKVQETARQYIGTRWQHQGRIKGVGIDCIGLIICVAHDLRLSDFDSSNYSRQPVGSRLRNTMAEEMDVVQRADMAPGDVVLMRFNGEPQHVGIVSDIGGRLGLIHAFAQRRMVVEHGLDDLWASRIVAVYRFKEVPEQE